eukprot:211424_1
MRKYPYKKTIVVCFCGLLIRKRNATAVENILLGLNVMFVTIMCVSVVINVNGQRDSNGKKKDEYWMNVNKVDNIIHSYYKYMKVKYYYYSSFWHYVDFTMHPYDNIDFTL